MEIEHVLASVSLFHNLDKKHVRALSRLVREQDYAPGQLIVQEGQPGLGLYVISEGSADVIQGGALIRTLRSGDFFGEMSLLDDLPRTADVRASAPTRCLTLTKWEFLGELESHPQMALPMLPMLSRRVRVAEERADRLRGELAHPS